MAKLSPSDEADLVLLAILFFFLVLFSSAVADEGQNAERRHETSQRFASTECSAAPEVADRGRAVSRLFDKTI